MRRKRDGQMAGRWMQGRTHGKIMLLSHTLTMRGHDVASLVEFRPVVKEEIALQTNRRTHGRMHGRTHRKIMLLLHTLIMRGIDVASLVELRPVV